MAGQKDPVELYYNLTLMVYANMLRIGGSVQIYLDVSVKYHSFFIYHLTQPRCKLGGEHCLVGSLTGEVAC